jgi:hypothetical protein
MSWGKGLAFVGALVIAGTALTSCSGSACDTALRYNTLVLDFSSLTRPSAELDFLIDCPGREDRDACTAEPAGKRFEVSSESSVYVWPGVRAVHVTVYEKNTQNVVTEKSLDPVPWDPPEKPNTCATPAKATLKL